MEDTHLHESPGNEVAIGLRNGRCSLTYRKPAWEGKRFHFRRLRHYGDYSRVPEISSGEQSAVANRPKPGWNDTLVRTPRQHKMFRAARLVVVACHDDRAVVGRGLAVNEPLRIERLGAARTISHQLRNVS
jgi:hypothetical protein